MSALPFPPEPVLLVDDDESWLHSFAFTLEYSGGLTNVLTCNDSREVMPLLSRQQVSLAVLDLTMPHHSGEDLVEMITERFPGVPVIIVSGVNEAEAAVRCLKAGAYNYFVKTSQSEQILAGIRNALALKKLRGDNRRMREQLLLPSRAIPEAFSGIVTRCQQMFTLFHYVVAVAGSCEPLLITGESGTGKELVARASHQLRGADTPFVAVNVAGLDDQIFADTLFGHVRGAFTGADRPRGGMIEQADGGTLFLDEIGDLTLASQVKLLRLLQDREYFPIGSDRPKRMTARIVCATNQDLAGKVASGHFRKDLYYRLQTHHVELPPLRQRPEDIPLLIEHFLAAAAADRGRSVPNVPAQLPGILAVYSFPGNIRQLRAMVYDAVSLATDGVLPMEPFYRQTGSTSPAEGNSSSQFAALLAACPALPTLEAAADVLTDEALRRSGGNQTAAARLLGLSQPALSKRLKKQRPGSEGAGHSGRPLISLPSP